MAKKKVASIQQMQHRELAWLLYITEGYAANLRHALAVNCITFNSRQRGFVKQLVDRADATADEIRGALK